MPWRWSTLLRLKPLRIAVNRRCHPREFEALFLGQHRGLGYQHNSGQGIQPGTGSAGFGGQSPETFGVEAGRSERIGQTPTGLLDFHLKFDLLGGEFFQDSPDTLLLIRRKIQMTRHSLQVVLYELGGIGSLPGSWPASLALTWRGTFGWAGRPVDDRCRDHPHIETK